MGGTHYKIKEAAPGPKRASFFKKIKDHVENLTLAVLSRAVVLADWLVELHASHRLLLLGQMPAAVAYGASCALVALDGDPRADRECIDELAGLGDDAELVLAFKVLAVASRAIVASHCLVELNPGDHHALNAKDRASQTKAHADQSLSNVPPTLRTGKASLFSIQSMQ